MKSSSKAAISEEAGIYPCLSHTPLGRIFHCPEFRRFVIDFMGVYLVLREEEFHRLREYFIRMKGCSWSRSRIEQGERIRLTDALGERTLILGLAEVSELLDLMEAGASSLQNAASDGLWHDR